MRWRLSLILQISQGSVSTYFRWSAHFRYSSIKRLFRDNLCNFYWNRFIFDRKRAKDKLAQFFLRHGVLCCCICFFFVIELRCCQWDNKALHAYIHTTHLSSHCIKWCSPVLGKIIFEMISNQNQNHESLTDLKSWAKSNHKKWFKIKITFKML